MANYGNKSYTSFQNVNLKYDTIRFENGATGTEGTLSLGANVDGARAWQLPNKSGTMPIAGTFALQLPAAASAFFSTVVTVSGIRANDGLTVSLSETGTYTYGTQGTAHFLQRATPGAGSITLFFQNPGNSTGYIELIGSYTAVRS